ncbi:DUF4912 domain-containing protein [Chrysosporum ovalisporum FSS-45]|uniref:DUF4912 domain-containing protein n=1 Tax=Umezakia ovalisporum TaxID=75695 RepID=UPI002474CD7E|nr:DUF4912 domain-containing protein [Umezakia ovalisporum]MDH6079765.1 DUF4912 domain-containing protein [Umezakia ovalisporum FSS-45]
MWQQEKKESAIVRSAVPEAIVSLALFLSLATTPMAAFLFVSTPVLARSATENETLSDEPNYLDSRSLVHTYRQNPNLKANFLGFALASQQAIKVARGTAIAQGEAPSNTEATSESNQQQPLETIPNTEATSESNQQQPLETIFNLEELPRWWFLLPTAAIFGLLMWVFQSRLWVIEAKNSTPDPNANASSENEVAINDTNLTSSADEPLAGTADHDADLAPEAKAAISSVVRDNINNQKSLETNNLSNVTSLESFDDQSPWDMEAPADVVNIPYPQLPDLSQPISEESKAAEVLLDSEAENYKSKDFSEETAEQPQIELNQNTNLAGDIDNTSQLNNDNETILTLSIEEVISSDPTLSDITEDILNVVADAAEPTNCETDIFADGATFVETDMGSSVGNQSHLECEGEMLSDAIEGAVFNFDGERSIALKPRNSQWAYVSWYLDKRCQQALETNGISQLALRLYDVTDLDLSYQTPELVHQYELESGEVEKYIPIPRSSSDYISEIGYLTQDDCWVRIARSERVRVFYTPLQDTTEEPLFSLDGERSITLKPRSFQWAYVSWYIDRTCQEALETNGILQLALRLYDVTDLDLSYQRPELVQQYELESKEVEKYIPIPQSNSDYIAEIGYVTQGHCSGRSAGGNAWVTIARSPRVRVFDTVLQDTIEEPLFNLDGEGGITIKPRNSQWAYVSWYIDRTCQEALETNGISQLALRLYDVTDLDLSYQRPELVQQYELESKEVEKYIPIPQSNSDYIAEIGYVTQGHCPGRSAGGNSWVTIARSARVRAFYTLLQDTIEEPLFNLDGEQSITLKSRNSQWAYASWYIDRTGQEALETNGISQLALRLYDVTDLDLSYQRPELVQQYELELARKEKYIAIPQSDRDYIAEIGYVIRGDIWVSISRSERIRVFGIPLTDTRDENIPTTEITSVDLPSTNNESKILLKPRTPKWAYAIWYISTNDQQTLENKNISQLYLRLYDVTDLDLSYQTPKLVRQYECDEITSDRYVGIPAVDHDYIAEIGYVTKGDCAEPTSEGNHWEMIVRSERIRVFGRPQPDFWFITDTELIIHGSTEPSATVNISGKPIKIRSDGTFHLRLPCSKNLIDYMMTAIAANGEQSTTIRKKFSQEDLES